LADICSSFGFPARGQGGVFAAITVAVRRAERIPAVAETHVAGVTYVAFSQAVSVPVGYE